MTSPVHAVEFKVRRMHYAFTWCWRDRHSQFNRWAAWRYCGRKPLRAGVGVSLRRLGIELSMIEARA